MNIAYDEFPTAFLSACDNAFPLQPIVNKRKEYKKIGLLLGYCTALGCDLSCIAIK